MTILNPSGDQQAGPVPAAASPVPRQTGPAPVSFTPAPSATAPIPPDPIVIVTTDGSATFHLTLAKKIHLCRIFGDDNDAWPGPQTLYQDTAVLYFAAADYDSLMSLAPAEPGTGADPHRLLPLIQRPAALQRAIDSFLNTIPTQNPGDITRIASELWLAEHSTQIIPLKKNPPPPAPAPAETSTTTPSASPPTGPSYTYISSPRPLIPTADTTSSTPSDSPKSTPPSTPPATGTAHPA